MSSDCSRKLCGVVTFVLLLFTAIDLSSPQRPVPGHWSVWSVCSRSCGGGASVRTRTCVSRDPLSAECAGEPRQYRICNTRVCPVGSQDFRELQCAAFNDRPLVGGKTFRWTTFTGGSDPCELSCLAQGQKFYFNFGRVLDGTACEQEGGRALCVNGRCLRAGCDSVLGSELQTDVCMVCGGNNSTCRKHRSVYQSNELEAGPFGYNQVTTIPAGATHIRVTDNSRNYLALQNGRSQFVINGNWRISVPGEYNVAGSKVVYRRSADSWESLEVLGPTEEDLHLMVLSTDSIPGIEYEYWLPPDQYALHHGGTSPLRQPRPNANFLPGDEPSARTTDRLPWFYRYLNPPQSHLQPVLPRLQREENHRNLLPQPSGHCGTCHKVKGRRQRRRQYCQKDFVFRAKIVRKLYRGEETRYDIQIIHTYRNRFRLEHREFLWVPNVCDCPRLDVGRQYILMARRHINHEQTLNRILLEEDAYTLPFRAREDELLQPLHRLCSNRAQQPA